MTLNGSLRPEFANAYWRVIEPFRVYLLMAEYPSNTFFGSSRAYGNLYCETTVSTGDEFHALVGGTFLVTTDGVRQAKIKLSDKHPFERVYIPPREVWPLDKLTRLADGTRPEGGYRRPLASNGQRLAEQYGAVTFGRSIDYVYTQPMRGDTT